MFFKMPCMCDLLYSAGIHFICELLLLIQPFTVPVTGMDALTLNYWLSKFVLEMAKSSKYPYPPKTLNQIVCGIRRFMVEKNPAIELILWTLQTQGESVPRKVEKVSQNVDIWILCQSILVTLRNAL